MLRNHRHRPRRGLSLLELLTVVLLLGIIAVIAVPRFMGSSDDAKAASCHINTGNIEIQAALWQRNKGSWPAADLNDIFADTKYFPDGAPVCPFDGSSYSFDAATGEVDGHTH